MNAINNIYNRFSSDWKVHKVQKYEEKTTLQVQTMHCYYLQHYCRTFQGLSKTHWWRIFWFEKFVYHLRLIFFLMQCNCSWCIFNSLFSIFFQIFLRLFNLSILFHIRLSSVLLFKLRLLENFHYISKSWIFFKVSILA